MDGHALCHTSLAQTAFSTQALLWNFSSTQGTSSQRNGKSAVGYWQSECVPDEDSGTNL